MKSPRGILLLIPIFIAVSMAGCVDQPFVDSGSEDGISEKAHQPGQNLPAHANAPVRLTFYKSLTDADNLIWNGTVEGDIEGDLETRGTILKASGPVLHVAFDWIIDADNPDQSFTAHLTGTLNTNTGRVVMNGTVVDGFLEGARVHEQGQATEPREQEDVMPFEGSIRIMPGTAN